MWATYFWQLLVKPWPDAASELQTISIFCPFIPAQEHDIGQPFRVIAVHVGEEDRAQFLRSHRDLRQPHLGTAAHIELQFDGAATVAVVAVLHEASGASEAVEDRRSA